MNGYAVDMQQILMPAASAPASALPHVQDHKWATP
jgi:hypothetical protein